jgi:hypothetical protein
MMTFRSRPSSYLLNIPVVPGCAAKGESPALPSSNEEAITRRVIIHSSHCAEKKAAAAAAAAAAATAAATTTATMAATASPTKISIVNSQRASRVGRVYQ